MKTLEPSTISAIPSLLIAFIPTLVTFYVLKAIDAISMRDSLGREKVNVYKYIVLYPFFAIAGFALLFVMWLLTYETGKLNIPLVSFFIFLSSVLSMLLCYIIEKKDVKNAGSSESAGIDNGLFTAMPFINAAFSALSFFIPFFLGKLGPDSYTRFTIFGNMSTAGKAYLLFIMPGIFLVPVFALVKRAINRKCFGGKKIGKLLIVFAVIGALLLVALFVYVAVVGAQYPQQEWGTPAG